MRWRGPQGVKYAAVHSDELQEGLQALRELERAPPAGGGPGTGVQEAGQKAGSRGEAGGRTRAVQSLFRWMFLYFIADPEGCEADLAMELQRVYQDSLEESPVQSWEGVFCTIGSFLNHCPDASPLVHIVGLPI
jgi:hypothetical protein